MLLFEKIRFLSHYLCDMLLFMWHAIVEKFNTSFNFSRVSSTTAEQKLSTMHQNHWLASTW